MRRLITLQLMVVFFGLPYLGVNFTRFPAAIFAFILNYTAYFVEIFEEVCGDSPGQYESLKVLGIGKVRGFSDYCASSFNPGLACFGK